MTTTRELLTAHGIDAHEENGIIAVSGFSSKFAILLFGHPSAPGRTMLQVDALVALADGTNLIESCAGWGDNFDEALATGLRNFSAYSLHQLMSAFFGHQECDQVELEQWSIGGTSWTAHLGGINAFEYEDTGMVPTELIHSDFFTAIESLVKQKALETKPHWLRAYRMYMPGQEPTIEVLLDNEQWPEAEKAVAKLDWTEHPVAWQCRFFMVLTPEGWTGR